MYLDRVLKDIQKDSTKKYHRVMKIFTGVGCGRAYIVNYYSSYAFKMTQDFKKLDICVVVEKVSPEPDSPRVPWGKFDFIEDD